MKTVNREQGAQGCEARSGIPLTPALSRKGRGSALAASLAGGDIACGFTIIELLTVVAIMLILMAIAVTSYRGFVRAGAARGTASNLRSMLSMARQYAVTYRARTFVKFSQDGTNAHYVVCAQEGVHEGPSSPTWLTVSAPKWDPGTLVGGVVYNLSDGSSGAVAENTDRSIRVSALTGGTRNRWDYGDRYGWAIHDQEHLAPTWVFNSGARGDVPDTVVFNPDGTTPRADSGYSVIMHEKYVGITNTIIVRVSGLTGLISVD